MRPALSPQIDLSRPSVTADSWGRYYTAEWVGRSLIGAMAAARPRLIVELGAGRGALATAAAKKWKHAQLITVDMDHGATRVLGSLLGGKPGTHKHHVHDALDDDLAAHIGLSLGSVDVAVCNPPYVRPRWRSSFGRILEDAGLSGALESVHDAGADLLFIAQNLRLLKQHGKLGLILPDGLITAEKFAGVRGTLLREHRVEQVVQLPRRVFAGTEAQTYLVVLSKRAGETDTVTLRRVGQDGSVSSPLAITADLARRRLDYDYHVSLDAIRIARKRKRPQYLRDIATGVTRGSFSSQEIAECDWPVFHLTDFVTGTLVVPKRFSLSKRAREFLPPNARLSLPGDILIARIGRNLHEKVAIVKHGSCTVSDCVFTLRVAQDKREALLQYLASPRGRQLLQASAHGVGARYLSMTDLLDLEVPT
ncbi:N-6 DNA methylase [Cupriavidus sp. H19C3]|uniref:N-6 DNA methylase n=1 Tax=Cupriavidus sp. H19C3 TaxID=3241603 RepID=UPI003BF77B5C